MVKRSDACVEHLRNAPDQLLGRKRLAGDGFPADALGNRDRLPLEVFPGLRRGRHLSRSGDRLPVRRLREARQLVVWRFPLHRGPLAVAVLERVLPDRVAAGALDLSLEVPERERIQIVDRRALRALEKKRRILKYHRIPLFGSLDDLFLLQFGDVRAAEAAQLCQDVLVVRADRVGADAQSAIYPELEKWSGISWQDRDG